MSTPYNFCFPLDLKQLQNDRLQLVPFDTDLLRHAELYATQTKASPKALVNFDFLPYGPFNTAEDFLKWYQPTIQANQSVVWFAIFVKPAAGSQVSDSDDSAFAGTIAYLNAEVGNASVELGHLNILPPFQRTFVNTHACGLLLNYALTPPSTSPSEPSGLGLRRTQWFANALNAPSRRAAERLGFKFEGILRWHRILPANKIDALQEQTEGDGESQGQLKRKLPWQDGRGTARDSALLSLCWDDWFWEGGREKVVALMARQ